jgi:EAL domain-containing protein (putative c-di-GMP-specific phosphodiesterase class I)
MGRALELDVVAEGIEDRPQLIAVLGVGCEVGQGFYFSKAEEPDQLVSIIDSGFADTIPGAWSRQSVGGAAGS